MSTIEDKILDGPRVHYCEAGNDDLRHDENEDESQSRGNVSSLFVRPDEEEESVDRINSRFPGCSANTGPKGVIEDHKLSLNRKQKPTDDKDLDAEFLELMNDDSILKEYISKRLTDQSSKNYPTFGQVSRLQSGSELLSAIDNENPNVLVVVHIYTKFSRSCRNVDRCLDELASDLKHVKFVTLDASTAGLSANFKDKGVPALLAYKNGDLIKSLVQLQELLDKDFEAAQIKDLMIDAGLIH